MSPTVQGRRRAAAAWVSCYRAPVSIAHSPGSLPIISIYSICLVEPPVRELRRTKGSAGRRTSDAMQFLPSPAPQFSRITFVVRGRTNGSVKTPRCWFALFCSERDGRCGGVGYYQRIVGIVCGNLQRSRMSALGFAGRTAFRLPHTAPPLHTFHTTTIRPAWYPCVEDSSAVNG